MRAVRFQLSAVIQRHQLRPGVPGGRGFAENGSGNTNNGKSENALLTALIADAPIRTKSKGVSGGNPSDGTVRRPQKLKPIKKMSFFDEVDIFLAKEKQKSVGRNSSVGAKPRSQLAASKASLQSTTSTSPSWTSYLEDGNAAPKKTIFDIFKVPDPVPERSEFAYDEDAYNDYSVLLESVSQEANQKSKLSTEEKADVDKWLQREEPEIPLGLPLMKQICEQGIESLEDATRQKRSLKEQAIMELEKQAQVFCKQLGWNKQQYTYATDTISKIADESRKTHKALPVVIIWEKMKEAGFLQQEIVSDCIKASTSFSGASLSRGRSILGGPLSGKSRLYDILEGKNIHEKDNATESNKEDNIASIPEQFAAANDMFFQPTEQSTLIRTKRLINLGYADEALELIESSLPGGAKLRSYAQVFGLYLELGKIDSAFLLFEKMKEQHEIVPVEPEMFVQLLVAIADAGYFSQGVQTIGSTSWSSGPALFDHLAEEMSEYVSSISSASAKRLQRALKSGRNDEGPSDNEVIRALAPLKPLACEKVPDGNLIADRVTVDAASGFCVCSNVNLRLIGLEHHQKEEMKDSLVNIVKSRYANKKGDQLQAQALELFWEEMCNYTGRPYTVIIDGPNVAYYMQNFDRGKFNFHQIQFAVNALESIGEHPLVVLPQRYTRTSFHHSLGSKKQQATEEDRAILKRLQENHQLYLVPQGCLDDYFWLLASVADQVSSQRADVDDTHLEDKPHWPGSRPVVMTNDQIRDHQEFQFLRPRLFNRWYSSTIMNYNFTGFVDNECVDPEIFFSPADVYSKEIQGNVPDTGKPDFSVGKTWHFPVQDWDTDWFCIRLPSE